MSRRAGRDEEVLKNCACGPPISADSGAIMAGTGGGIAGGLWIKSGRYGAEDWRVTGLGLPIAPTLYAWTQSGCG